MEYRHEYLRLTKLVIFGLHVMGLCTKVDWCMGTETNNTPMDEASRDIPSSEPIPGFAVLHDRGERYLIPRFIVAG